MAQRIGLSQILALDGEAQALFSFLGSEARLSAVERSGEERKPSLNLRLFSLVDCLLLIQRSVP